MMFLSLFAHLTLVKMRTWGQVLVAFAVLASLGLATSNDPQGDQEGIKGIIIFGGVGTYLWVDGKKRLDKLQACADASLKSNREKGYVDCLSLSGTLQIPETQVRVKIAKAQKKGWVPYGIEIK